MATTKKRKVGTTDASAPAKKVRAVDETVIAEPSTNAATTIAERPKRTSAGEPPRYNFILLKLTAAQKAEKETAEAKREVKRATGRPARVVKDGVKEEKAPATLAKASPGKKPVGRPRKSPMTRFTRIKSRGTKQSARSAVRETVTKTVTKSKAKVSTKAAAKAKSASKRGPGRPKKDAPTTIVSLESTKTEPATRAEKEDQEYGKYPDRQYFLMKAEPESRIENGYDVKFSIDDLEKADKPEPWDGVRNYVARNVMRMMRKGDLAFFYHSNCKIPGVVGVLRIVQEHSPDESAFNPAHPHYDPNSKRENPKWDVVHVEFVKKFDEIVTLQELRSFAEKGGVLENMQTLKQSRLSVSEVTPKQWSFILGLAGEENLEETLWVEGNEVENEVDDEETEIKAAADEFEDVDGDAKR